MKFTGKALSILLLVSAVSLNAMDDGKAATATTGSATSSDAAPAAPAAPATAKTATTDAAASENPASASDKKGCAHDEKPGYTARAWAFAKGIVVGTKDGVIAVVSPIEVTRNEVDTKGNVTTDNIAKKIKENEDAYKDARLGSIRLAAANFATRHGYVANTAKYATLGSLVVAAGYKAYDAYVANEALALADAADEVVAKTARKGMFLGAK